MTCGRGMDFTISKTVKNYLLAMLSAVVFFGCAAPHRSINPYTSNVNNPNAIQSQAKLTVTVDGDYLRDEITAAVTDDLKQTLFRYGEEDLNANVNIEYKYTQGGPYGVIACLLYLYPVCSLIGVPDFYVEINTNASMELTTRQGVPIGMYRTQRLEHTYTSIYYGDLDIATTTLRKTLEDLKQQVLSDKQKITSALEGNVPALVAEPLVKDGPFTEKEPHHIIIEARNGDLKAIKSSAEIVEDPKIKALALIEAVKNNHADAVAILLKRTADVNLGNEYGSTALHWAAEKGSIEMIKALSEAKNANINAKNSNGATPLHWAADSGSAEAVKLLLEKGADAGAKDLSGATPLHWAAKKGHAGIVGILVAKGAPVNESTNLGVTPLHMAVDAGDAGIAQMLIDKGANVNGRTAYNASALQMAANRGSAGMVKLLLEKGADATVKTTYGWTALHWAAKGGDEETVRTLLDRGVDVNALTRFNSTALHFASAKGSEAIVRLLLQKEASALVMQSDGKTAQQVARQKGGIAVAKILEKAEAEQQAAAMKAAPPVQPIQPVQIVQPSAQISAPSPVATAVTAPQPATAMPVKFYFSYMNNPKDRRDWTLLNSATWVESQPTGVVTAFKIIGAGVVDNQKGTVVRRLPDEQIEYFIPDLGNQTMWVSFRNLPSGEWSYLSAMQSVEAPAPPPVFYQQQQLQRPQDIYQQAPPPRQDDGAEARRQQRLKQCIAGCDASYEACNSGCAAGSGADVAMGLLFGGVRSGLEKAAKGGAQCLAECASKRSSCVDQCNY